MTAFRLVDPERPQQKIWAFDKESALEKADELAAERKVSVWCAPDSLSEYREPVKSYRD